MNPMESQSIIHDIIVGGRVNPTNVINYLKNWYFGECWIDGYSTDECTSECPMWKYCERLCDLAEEIIEDEKYKVSE